MRRSLQAPKQRSDAAAIRRPETAMVRRAQARKTWKQIWARACQDAHTVQSDVRPHLAAQQRQEDVLQGCCRTALRQQGVLASLVGKGACDKLVDGP